MAKLVVNAGTPQAWEIELKPGTNHLGRGITNDFKVNDLSVSGSHCQIVVNNGTAVIKDLGSTNGTYVNRSQVQEAKLETGHTVRLGAVDMVFYSDGADSVVVTEVLPVAPQVSVTAPPLPAAAAAPPSAAAAPAPVRVSLPAAAPRLTVAGLAAPAAAAAPPMAPLMAPALEEAEPAAPTTATGPRFCKFHPKSPARFQCHKCNRTFCDLCVTSRNVAGTIKKMCRSCGVECMPLQVVYARPKGFFASIPGAFVYPVKGFGIVILICATVVTSALQFVSFFGFFSIFIKAVLYGFVFLFMQNIIHTTTSDENEPLGLPEAGDLGGAASQLGGTILASFWLAIGLSIAKFFDVPIPGEAIMASVILGGVYFPMALLAVAMKDSVMAANPLVVIPAMMKVPAQYLVTVVLLLSVFGVRQLGGMMSGEAGTLSLRTHNMGVFFLAVGIQALWALASVYLLTVTMRILGLFYNSTKHQLGWFTH